MVQRFDVPQTTFCGNYHLIETQNMNNYIELVFI